MIQREDRIKIWYLIRRMAHKEGIKDICEEAKRDFWNYMRAPEGDIRYLLIEHYNLGEGFYYHAYEENEFDDKTESEKLKYMFEHYFADTDGDYTGETLLLIDVKKIKAYTLTKEIKYTKRAVK